MSTHTRRISLRPGLESMEDRATPSALSPVLGITGTPAAVASHSLTPANTPHTKGGVVGVPGGPASTGSNPAEV